MSSKPGAGQHQPRGLRNFIKEKFIPFIKHLSEILEWPQLLEIVPLAHDHNLRKIVLREKEYSFPGDTKKIVENYHLLLAVLCLYFVEVLAPDDGVFRNSVNYREFSEFAVEDYINNLFRSDPEADRTTLIYEFGKPTRVRATDLVEVLKKELGIKNPVEHSIGDFFNIPENGSSRYVCYRYASRKSKSPKEANQITKSIIEISRPRATDELYSFSHLYVDADNLPRKTPGFIVRFRHTYYFMGGSRQTEQGQAMALKVIAVPDGEESHLHNSAFIAGVFLSNDTKLHPVVGRFLMIQTHDKAEGEKIEEYASICGRIRERSFITDIASHARTDGKVVRRNRDWLISAINNNIGGNNKLRTVIFPYAGEMNK